MKILIIERQEIRIKNQDEGTQGTIKINFISFTPNPFVGVLHKSYLGHSRQVNGVTICFCGLKAQINSAQWQA